MEAAARQHSRQTLRTFLVLVVRNGVSEMFDVEAVNGDKAAAQMQSIGYEVRRVELIR